MTFNIDTLEQSSQATFDLVIGHLDKEKTKPVGFSVVGTTSAEYAAVSRQIDMMNVKEAAARNKAGEGPASQIDLASDEGAAQVVDSGDTRRMMIAKACTVGWFGFVKGSANEPAEFTDDALTRLLALRPQWARKIVDAVETDGNFIAG